MDNSLNANRVDFRELVMGLLLFKDKSVHEKLRAFFSLTVSHMVSYEEIYHLVRMNIVIDNDLPQLNKILSRIFREHQNLDGHADKQSIY